MVPVSVYRKFGLSKKFQFKKFASVLVSEYLVLQIEPEWQENDKTKAKTKW